MSRGTADRKQRTGNTRLARLRELEAHLIDAMDLAEGLTLFTEAEFDAACRLLRVARLAAQNQAMLEDIE